MNKFFVIFFGVFNKYTFMSILFYSSFFSGIYNEGDPIKTAASGIIGSLFMAADWLSSDIKRAKG